MRSDECPQRQFTYCPLENTLVVEKELLRKKKMSEIGHIFGVNSAIKPFPYRVNYD